MRADNTMSQEAIILLSGGLDSCACLHFFLELGHPVSALYIDYGHAAAREEMVAAKSITAHYGVNLSTIRCLGFPFSDEGFIKGRNAFLLNCALMVCGNLTSGMVVIGIHSGSSYADCTPEFVNLMQNTYDLYTQGSIRIVTPLLTWNKMAIWRYCQDNHVPFQKTYSCEVGDSIPCGHCLSCKDIKSLHAFS